MEFADVELVCKKFAHTLQVPNKLYTIQYFPTSEKGELRIELSDETTLSIVVSASSVQTLFTGEYNLEEFVQKDFDSKLSLLYILSVIFFSTVGKYVNFSFEETLSLIFDYNITNWKDLTKALCQYVDLECDVVEDIVWIQDAPLTYDAELQMLSCDNIDYQIHSFVDFVSAIFKLVDYFDLMKQDEMEEEEESEVIEMLQQESNNEGPSSIMNISPDFTVPTGMEEDEIGEVIEDDQG